LQRVVARGFECDVGDPVSVESTFARIRSEFGEVNVLLYNAGSGVFGDVETITPDQFEQAWRINPTRKAFSRVAPNSLPNSVDHFWGSNGHW
jgi:NAD(P)-dependent dehydrogenase (short-subunit alcohol dehydrogenase family)